MFGGAIGFWEVLILLFAGVIIFGKQLPDVGRALGKGLMEFKKGLRGLEDTLDVSRHVSSLMTEPNREAAPAPAPPPRVATKAPKFQDEPVDSPA